MSRILYDLAGEDESLRFSPYCWRTKLALAHKNLTYDTLPWHFSDKDKIAFSGQGKVPVLIDGSTIIADSQLIADYLEEAYPHEPSLYGDAPGRALTFFVKSWTERVLHRAISLVVLPDIHAKIAPQDRAYFRATREAAFKRTLEDIAADRQEAQTALDATLKPLHATLDQQPFIAGDTPNYADHIVFGALAWGRLISSTPLLSTDDPLARWMEAVLETYGLPAMFAA
ncbi:glutathione S-transferase N-terminal domain-containing protein [Acidocella sp.]|uniref:glutathione S-transferase N-terminal domain-containing protein n=1 Tax=Acidocella sp. TaxID=50710 RepID=UPI00261544E6|nr:glutathione S-transferase N-terminal domain-containing protein [Acidocella sp.]